MKHLQIYREVCLKYLLSRAKYFTEEVDYYIDLALRQVSGLPMKPEGHDEYNGLVGMKPVNKQRVQCLKLIKQRLIKDSVQTADLSLDASVRTLNKLPLRPTGKDPYSALFRIDEEVEEKEKAIEKSASASEFKTSKVGLDLIHSFESYRECTYKDPGSYDGLPITGGWGSTRLNGNKLSLGQCYPKEVWDAQFARDLEYFENAIKKYVKVSLNQNQFDALCSWVYNCGVGVLVGSTAIKRLNNKDYKGCAEALTWWNKGGNGKVLAGLVRRRQAEKDLFLS